MLALAAGVQAGDPGAAPPALALGDAFDPAAVRRPKAGEWLEYLVAIHADPLENNLSAPPAPAPAAPPLPNRPEAESYGREHPYLAAFNPPTVWKVLPLRLEIREVSGDSCRVAMTFGDEVRTLTLPLAVDPAGAAFRYDPPQPLDRKSVHQVNGRRLEVDLIRREGRNYGFARLSSAELPFGLARFATADVDVILIGTGTGTPPAFPLAAQGAVDPPPGAFYTDSDVLY